MVAFSNRDDYVVRNTVLNYERRIAVCRAVRRMVSPGLLGGVMSAFVFCCFFGWTDLWLMLFVCLVLCFFFVGFGLDVIEGWLIGRKEVAEQHLKCEEEKTLWEEMYMELWPGGPIRPLSVCSRRYKRDW